MPPAAAGAVSHPPDALPVRGEVPRHIRTPALYHGWFSLPLGAARRLDDDGRQGSASGPSVRGERELSLRVRRRPGQHPATERRRPGQPLQLLQPTRRSFSAVLTCSLSPALQYPRSEVNRGSAVVNLDNMGTMCAALL